MNLLKITLSFLLCAALCQPMWSVAVAAENDTLPEAVAGSGADEPREGKETPLIPLESSTPAEGEPLREPIVIYALFDSNQDVDQLLILQIDSDISAGLPEFVYGYYSRFGMVECPVVWDTSTLTSPGRYSISGTVSAPEGYILKEETGLEQTSIIIAVYKDEPVVFFNGDGMDEAGLFGVQVLARGGTLPKAPYEMVDIGSLDGDWLKVPVAWDFSAVDLDILGWQTAYTMPILPPGAGFVGEPIKIPQRYYVMEPDAVDLGAYDINGQTISCEWLTEIDPEQAALELSEDGERWLAATDMMPETYIDIFDRYLIFSTASLEIGKEYFFRLVYMGRWDGVLRVTTTQDSMLPPDWEGDRDGGDGGGWEPDGGDTEQRPPTPDNELGNGNDGNGGSGTGNRGGTDGGQEDNESHTPPPNITPPLSSAPTPTPTPPTEATPAAEPTSTQSEPPQQETQPLEESKPAPQPPTQTDAPSIPAIAAHAAEESDDFVELFGETRDLISGTRLLLMVESGGQARFSKQGVTVTFSAQAVSGLGIQDSDRIAVTIEKERADRFSFSLSVNDTPVTDLENTHVMVPYALQTPGASLSLRNAEETEVAKGSYDAAPAVAFFTVNTTGRFAIIEDESVPAASAPQQPAAPIGSAVGIVGALLLAAALGFLLKRRPRP